MLYNREHQDAARIASEAGQMLLHLRKKLAGEGVDAATLKSEGDRQSHEFIMRALATAYPDDAVLSEEGADDQARLQYQRVWIVDPLDGTREFSELERTDWAIHVALAVNGEPVVAAVALPARNMTLSTASPTQPTVRADGPLRIVVSRTRPPDIALALATRLNADLVRMGSAGAKVSAVVLGDADIYVHAGGQYEWDSAAPVGVALAAGFHASRIDGSALRYNQPNPWLPDLLVCRYELAKEVLALLNTFAQEKDGKDG